MAEFIQQMTGVRLKIIDAVREMLEAFPPGSSPNANALPTSTQWRSLNELTGSPSPMAIYEAVGMLWTVVRWMSVETGRGVDEILNGLADPPSLGDLLGP